MTDSALPASLVVPGLDAHTRYRAEGVDLGAAPTTVQDASPPWLADGVTLTGAVLMGVGMAMPLLAPGNAVVLSLRAVED